METPTWLKLPADLSSLKPAMQFLRQGALASGMSAEDCGKLDLVVEELVVNIALYAFPKGAAGVLEVGFQMIEPGLLFVQICDSGSEFNPLDSDPPDFSRGLADRPVGGLGIFLVKSIGESMTYKREPDRNIISFYLRSGC